MKRAAVITPFPLAGRAAIMPSKSISHRLAVCAALAGNSTVSNIGLSDDIFMTRGALASLGFSCELVGPELCAGSAARKAAARRFVECGESGSTLRLLLPLALDGTSTRFTGKGRLLARPIEPYAEMFRGRGATFRHTREYIEVRGRLTPGVYSLRGDVSSQFVSGLMLALPRLDGDSLIELTTPLESGSYVDLTVNALECFGVEVVGSENGGLLRFEVPGGQTFRPGRASVEGDYSHAAFWLVAGAVGGGFSLSGLRAESAQGDAAVIEILRRMNADIGWRGGELSVNASRLRGTEIDIAQTPDIFPVLSVAACVAEGETVFRGGRRLRMKESDRLAAMASELAKLGAAVRETEDALYVSGAPGGKLRGGRVSAHADHRIAMSLAVAASVCGSEVRIDDADCVKKSAPDFWREYAAAGGKYNIESEAR